MEEIIQIIQIRFKFLAEGDPQERNYSLFASQKQCFHHLKTLFLPPKNGVFGVWKRRFRKSKMTDFYNAFIISNLQNLARIAFLRPKWQLVTAEATLAR